MNILFIGSVKFSEYALKQLIDMQADVIGVCSAPSSTINSDHADLSLIADRFQIPCRSTPDINHPEVISWIQNLNPDIIFCFGWSQLIKKQLLAIPPMGIVGYHPSYLPLNRGRHPLIWALVLGLEETASTFFFMDEGADSGDILSQVPVIIEKSDSASDLYKRITTVAMEQIREFVPSLSTNTYERIPQIHTSSNTWRKRGIPDGIIDWRMAAVSIHNLVRGLSHPYIGAQFSYNGTTFKVWKTEIENNAPNNLEPGKVLAVSSKNILVKSGLDAIRICEIEPNINLKPGDYL
tara:strand:- start:22 stop:903 length:882 start_codon:yes stop_codon:yes gene_type:complete